MKNLKKSMFELRYKLQTSFKINNMLNAYKYKHYQVCNSACNMTGNGNVAETIRISIDIFATK